MKMKVGLALLAAGLWSGALAADDVLLTNGETFEGVIAEREGDHVRIRLEFGELRLRAASVERIDRSRSALAEYLDRRRELLQAGGTAREWLELARWARSRELEHGYRESLLEAAAADPRLEELAPGMRALGYVFDAELDRWMPHAEQMRRAGWVRHRGEWMRPEERVAASTRTADERRSIEESLSRTVEILARAQLERETRETEEARRETRAEQPPYGFPVAYFGGWYVPRRPRPPAATPRQAPAPEPPLLQRIPGSLLPPAGANSGSRIRPPGSLLPAVSSRRD